MSSASLGKDLNDVLKEVEAEKAESAASTKSKKDDIETEAALNVNIRASTVKGLRLIAVHNDTTLKEIVDEVLTKWVKRERKKVIDELSAD